MGESTLRLGPPDFDSSVLNQRRTSTAGQRLDTIPPFVQIRGPEPRSVLLRRPTAILCILFPAACRLVVVASCCTLGGAMVGTGGVCLDLVLVRAACHGCACF